MPGVINVFKMSMRSIGADAAGGSSQAALERKRQMEEIRSSTTTSP